MSSFLANCPQCANLIPKDSNCPNCNYVVQGEGAANNPVVQSEFARRRRAYDRNCAKSVLMRMIGGVLGLSTAICWFMFLFGGIVAGTIIAILAFIGVIVMTPLSAIFGVLLVCVEKNCSTNLHCPKCESQIDGVGSDYQLCPACSVSLTAPGTIQKSSVILSAIEKCSVVS